jgi:hypothetical protein
VSLRAIDAPKARQGAAISILGYQPYHPLPLCTERGIRGGEVGKKFITPKRIKAMTKLTLYKTNPRRISYHSKLKRDKKNKIFWSEYRIKAERSLNESALSLGHDNKTIKKPPLVY